VDINFKICDKFLPLKESFLHWEFESKFYPAIHQTRRHEEVKGSGGIAPRILNRCPGLR